MSISGKFQDGHSKAAKLSIEEVFEIREHYAEGATQSALARHYGVTPGTIGRIVRGESWMMGAKAGRHQGTPAEFAKSYQRFLQMNGVSSPEELIEKQAKGLLHAPQKTEEEKSPMFRMPADPAISAIAASYGAVHTRTPPPSLLDGGEVSGEEEGTGVSKLVQEASKTPEAIDQLLKRES